MSSSTEAQINLSVLQRIDSRIVEIIDNASEVNHFNYDVASGKWEDSGFEGSLFIYKRSCIPCHGFLIMNRLNTTNLLEPFINMMGFDLKEPYLLYENNSGNISCIWFYERQEYVRITGHFQRILASMKKKSEHLPKVIVQSGPSYILRNQIPPKIGIKNIGSVLEPAQLSNGSSQPIAKNAASSHKISSIQSCEKNGRQKDEDYSCHKSSPKSTNEQSFYKKEDIDNQQNVEPMCEALFHLLRTDSQLLTRVHEAYISSLQRHMKRVKL